MQSIYEGNLWITDDLETYEYPKAFKVKIVPHPGDVENNFSFVMLQVKFPRNYPIEEYPYVKIIQTEGITISEKNELGSVIVESITSSSLGEPFLYEILTRVQDYLVPKNRKPLSVYETMLVDKQKAEKQALQTTEEKINLEKKQIQDLEHEKQTTDQIAQMTLEEEATLRKKWLNLRKSQSDPINLNSYSSSSLSEAVSIFFFKSCKLLVSCFAYYFFIYFLGWSTSEG